MQTIAQHHAFTDLHRAAGAFVEELRPALAAAIDHGLFVDEVRAVLDAVLDDIAIEHRDVAEDLQAIEDAAVVAAAAAHEETVRASLAQF